MSEQSRAAIVAFALVASLLVVGAQPAAASHQLATASMHTTDADFNAGTLTNMSVVGTGDSATVDLVLASSGSYDAVSEDGDGTAEANEPLVGDSSSGSTYGTEYRINSNTGFTIDTILVDIASTSGSDYGFVVDVYIHQGNPDATQNGQLVKNNWNPAFGTGTQSISLDTTFDINADTNYTIEFDTQSTDSDGSADRLLLKTDDDSTTDGNWMNYFSGGLGAHDEIGALTVTGSVAGGTPGTYISQNHSEELSEQGFVNITENTNATVTVTWEAWTGSSWATLNETTGITSAGNQTFTWPVNDSDTIRVNVSVFNATGNGAPAFTVADEGVFFTANASDVDNSSATPTGTVTSTTQTFEIDVNDSDFPTVQGDQVNASLYIDGTLEGSVTLTANGTASVTLSSLTGGSHDYWWTVNDSYGHSTRSSNFSISSPSELSVFNESAPSTLVDNTTVGLRFYADELSDAPLIFTRNTSDGTTNMTGVPATESFIVVATADGYYDRRIFVPSIFETQEIYLLPENESGTETIFSIKDYSGDFPQDQTVLLVQRSINGSYTTVLGDYFGATGQFPAVIETGVRHRLVLYNTETGERQVAGTFTPLSASTQTVTVSPEGTVEVEGLDIVIDVDPSTRRLPAANDTSITINVRDGQNATVANWSVTATVVNASNATVVWTYSQSGAGSQSNTLNLTGYAGGELVVNVTANSTAGQMTSDSVAFRLDPVFDNDRSLLAVADRLVSLSPEQGRSDFTTFLAITLTIFLVGGVATQLPVSGDVAAFVGVLAIAGFTILGWTSPGLLFVTGVGFVGFAALRRGL